MSIKEIYESYTVSDDRKIKTNTRNCESKFFEKYIMPVIGNENIADLTPEMSHRVEEYAKSQGRGYGTLKKLRNILKRIYTYAVSIGEATRELVLMHSQDKSVLTERRLYTENEIKRIYMAFDKMSLGPLYGIVAELECPGTVARGITEDSILLEDEIIFLDHIVIEPGGDKSPYLEDRGASINFHPLHGKAKMYIQRQLKLQSLYKRHAQDAWSNPDNLLFTDSHGGFVTREMIRKSNEELIRLTGIPMLTLDRIKNIKRGHTLWDESEAEN